MTFLSLCAKNIKACEILRKNFTGFFISEDCFIPTSTLIKKTYIYSNTATKRPFTS